MIPEFDENGNLPPGIYSVPFDVVAERFSGKNLVRQRLTQDLRRFYNFIREHAARIYVDGSYTTRKLAPGDVDLFIVLQQDFEFVSPAGRKLLNYQHGRRYNRLHIYVAKERDRKSIRNLVNTFTHDRQDNEKGIILVE
jgi:hypothetical protein